MGAEAGGIRFSPERLPDDRLELEAEPFLDMLTGGPAFVMAAISSG